MALSCVHSVARVSCVTRAARSLPAAVTVAVIATTSVAASRANQVGILGLYTGYLVGGLAFAMHALGVLRMKIGMKRVLRTALTLLFLGSLAAPARADWFLTPYFGAAFGGASNQFVFNDLDDEFEQRMNFGGSFGWRSQGIFGVEVDYNVAPN